MDRDIERLDVSGFDGVETLDAAQRGTFGMDVMSYDTVDKDVQEWHRIQEAVAFRMPNGDEILVLRCVACPVEKCGKPLALLLATGDTIGYRRRHAGCEIVDESMQYEFDEDDNWVRKDRDKGVQSDGE